MAKAHKVLIDNQPVYYISATVWKALSQTAYLKFHLNEPLRLLLKKGNSLIGVNHDIRYRFEEDDLTKRPDGIYRLLDIAGELRLDLLLFKPSDFNHIFWPGTEKFTTANTAILLPPDAFKRAFECLGQDDNKPAFTGCYVDFSKKNQLTIVATNGLVLSALHERQPAIGKQGHGIVPRKATVLHGFLASGPTKLSLTNGQGLLDYGAQGQVYFDLIMKAYPDYEKVLAGDYAQQLRFDPETMRGQLATLQQPKRNGLWAVSWKEGAWYAVLIEEGNKALNMIPLKVPTEVVRKTFALPRNGVLVMPVVPHDYYEDEAIADPFRIDFNVTLLLQGLKTLGSEGPIYMATKNFKLGAWLSEQAMDVTSARQVAPALAPRLTKPPLHLRAKTLLLLLRLRLR